MNRATKHQLLINTNILQLVFAHDKNKKTHSISKQSYTFKQELNIHQNEENDTSISAKQSRDIKKTAKAEGLKQIKENCENKPLHGKYSLWSQNSDVDKGNIRQWLRSTGLKAETEGLIIAAQDQSLFTRNYQSKIIKIDADPKYRFCGKFKETVEHLIRSSGIWISHNDS